ncbi:Alcohol dehydrogenase 1 [Penicillium rolfsii]|nr:Alcohol dehydrogenase 1 [Penicillium rolfsii]
MIPATMKAQVLEAYSTPYRYTDVPLPELISPYDLLIQVEAASYCHTDAVCAAGGFEGHANAPRKWPHIGCHEFAGQIVALPKNISPTNREDSGGSAADWQIGERVGVPGRAFHPCGVCVECQRESDNHGLPGDRKGYSVYCPFALNLGLSAPGGFAQYAVVDARQVARLPRGMSALEAAPLMCAGLTIYSAIRACHLEPGQRIGIIGCGGGLGHLGLQFAQHMGLDVVGVDTGSSALALAQRVAPDATLFDAREVPASTARKSLSKGQDENGRNVVAAVIILPESQQAFDYGMELVNDRGTCMVVSFPRDGFRFSTQDVVFRRISIVGTLVGSNVLLREMLAFADRHKVRAASRIYPLSQLNEMIAQQGSGDSAKSVIDMSLA